MSEEELRILYWEFLIERIQTAIKNTDDYGKEDFKVMKMLLSSNLEQLLESEEFFNDKITELRLKK